MFTGVLRTGFFYTALCARGHPAVYAHTFPAVTRLVLTAVTQFYANTPVKFIAPNWVTLARH